MKMLCLVVSMLAVSVLALGAEARLYVSPSGDDTNPGTAERPWRSLQKAAEVVKPGDTVIVFHHIGNIETTTRYGLDGICDDADTSYDVYEGNVFHHIGRTGPPSVRFNLDHGIYTCGKHHRIVNNIFHHMNAGWGVQVAGYKTVDDLLISNNTFVFGNKRGHVVLWQPCHNVLIQNNIFYKPAVPNAIAFVSAELQNVVLRNNLVFGGGLKDDNDHGACSVSGTIVDQDPLFVDPPRGDFHRQAGAPALGVGARDSALGLDMDGKLPSRQKE